MRITPPISNAEYVSILSKQGFYIDPPYHQSWGRAGSVACDFTILEKNVRSIRDYLINNGWHNYKFIAAFMAFVTMNSSQLTVKMNYTTSLGIFNNLFSNFNILTCDRVLSMTRKDSGTPKQVRCAYFDGTNTFNFVQDYVGTSDFFATLNTENVPTTDLDYDPNYPYNSSKLYSRAFRFEKSSYTDKEQYSLDVQPNDWDHENNRYGMMGIFPASRYINWCVTNGKQWRNNYQSQIDFLESGSVWNLHTASNPLFPNFLFSDVKKHDYVLPTREQINAYLGKSTNYYESDAWYGAVFLNMIDTGCNTIVHGNILSGVIVPTFNENWYLGITTLTKVYYDYMLTLPPYVPPYVRKPSKTNYAMNAAIGNNKKRYIFMK